MLDISYPYILTVISSDADREDADHVIRCMGMAIPTVSSLSTPLAATSAGPATHWGLSTVAAGSLLERLLLPPAAIGVDFSPLSFADVAVLRARLVISNIERESIADISRLDQVAAANGLVRVEL